MALTGETGERPLLDYSGFRHPKMTKITEFAKFSSRKNKLFYSKQKQQAPKIHLMLPMTTSTT